jgi:8-oxo-dGTP pyrophosphatase MutT (NUDIX family)
MTEPRSQEPLAANNRPAEHVRAAGGVVVRVEASGRQEILLVHRPQYGDWTLPKGKARDGETDEACALREVEEETGLRCTLVRELASSEYIDRKKRPKVVRYWEMAPGGDVAAGHGEVDRVAWLPLEEAIAALTYPRDVEVVSSLASSSKGNDESR